MGAAQLRFELGEGVAEPHAPSRRDGEYDKLTALLDDSRHMTAKRCRKPLLEPLSPVLLACDLIGNRCEDRRRTPEQALDRIRAGTDPCYP